MEAVPQLVIYLFNYDGHDFCVNMVSALSKSSILGVLLFLFFSSRCLMLRNTQRKKAEESSLF